MSCKGNAVKPGKCHNVHEVIRKARDYVDFWKVGKLNHNKAVEQSVDWPKFRDDATALLEHYGCTYYIKEDLRKAS